MSSDQTQHSMSTDEIKTETLICASKSGRCAQPLEKYCGFLDVIFSERIQLLFLTHSLYFVSKSAIRVHVCSSKKVNHCSMSCLPVDPWVMCNLSIVCFC